jgi:hypothetical protein
MTLTPLPQLREKPSQTELALLASNLRRPGRGWQEDAVKDALALWQAAGQAIEREERKDRCRWSRRAQDVPPEAVDFDGLLRKLLPAARTADRLAAFRQFVRQSITAGPMRFDLPFDDAARESAILDCIEQEMQQSRGRHYSPAALATIASEFHAWHEAQVRTAHRRGGRASARKRLEAKTEAKP